MGAQDTSSEAELLAGFLPILEAHNQHVRREAASRGLSDSLVVGPGDDCAVLHLPQAPTVITTDTQTEGQEFRRVWPSGASTEGYDVGWKAATQNLADVAAMGAEPSTLVVSLSLPPYVSAEWVQGFAQGLVDSCRANQASLCTVSGGDLGRSSEISVTVTAVGQCAAQPVLRNGACPGDIVAVAGELGTAAAGFACLEYSTDHLAWIAEVASVVEAQQRPLGAITAGHVAAGCAHSMLDISDGLIRDAQRIALASGVSIDFSTAQLDPMVTALLPAARWLLTHAPAFAHDRGLSEKDLEISAQRQATQWVLSGGENHGMLATFAAHESIPSGFTEVGTCASANLAPKVTVDKQLPNVTGWDHFNRDR